MNKISIRQATPEDIPSILRVEIMAWGEELAATKDMFKSRMETFPEGILISIEDGKVSGVVVTQLVNYNIKTFSLSWYQATDNGYLKNTHNPQGRVIYGVNLSVLPSAMRGTGTALLETIGKLAIKLNLKYGMLGGRIPDYYKNKNIPVDEYLKKEIVVNGKKRLLDSELSFYKKAGLKIVRTLPNYMKDPNSLDYGVLLLWKNPFYYLTKYLPFLKRILTNIFKIS